MRRLYQPSGCKGIYTLQLGTKLAFNILSYDALGGYLSDFLSLKA